MEEKRISSMELSKESLEPDEVREYLRVIDTRRELLYDFKGERIYRKDILDEIHKDFLNVEIPFYPEKILVKAKKKPRSIWEREAEKIYEDLKNGRKISSRIIIDDDNLILKENSKRKRLRLIVTDDVKLCRALTKTTEIVVRIPFFLWDFYLDEKLKRKIKQFITVKEWPEVIFDTGGFEAFEQKHYLNGILKFGPVGDVDWNYQFTKKLPKRGKGKLMDNFPRGFIFYG